MKNWKWLIKLIFLWCCIRLFDLIWIDRLKLNFAEGSVSSFLLFLSHAVFLKIFTCVCITWDLCSLSVFWYLVTLPIKETFIFQPFLNAWFHLVTFFVCFVNDVYESKIILMSSQSLVSLISIFLSVCLSSLWYLPVCFFHYLMEVEDIIYGLLFTPKGKENPT